MMSDAPAHHLFCLLGPVDINRKALPEILAVIQVHSLALLMYIIEKQKKTIYIDFIRHVGLLRR